jgi:hypothetical protein
MSRYALTFEIFDDASVTIFNNNEISLSYDVLWYSILYDVSGSIVDRCQSLRKVVLRWGR